LGRVLNASLLEHTMSTLKETVSDKEFVFTARDFDRIRRLIYERAGIALGDNKQEMVYSRLTRRLRVLGLTSFETYLQSLESHVASPEWELFTNALTTNLTSFFRESHHFPVLAEKLKTCQKENGSAEVWCCASSTGEEPYSIAITACEAFGTLNPPVKILATDIDTQVLATAANGMYALDRVRDLSPEMLKRYFLRGTGKHAGFVRIRPELRKLIKFQPLNLLGDTWCATGPYDAIFCRNVMIYFDKPTQRTILNRFAPLIKADGLLFAGHSENLSFVTDLFTLQGKTVYALTGHTASKYGGR
jgi:chemotaxis protein methyltransferase CheR